MTVVACESCHVILRTKYEQFRECLIYDRVDGRQVEAKIVLRIICMGCRDIAIRHRTPKPSAPQGEQKGMF